MRSPQRRSRITFALLALAVPFALSACGRAAPTDTLTIEYVRPPDPSPDVRIGRLSFHGTCSVGIIPQAAGDGHAPGDLRPQVAVTEEVAYVGQTMTPNLRLHGAGDFPELRVRLEIDGRTWWDRRLPSVWENGRSTDLFFRTPVFNLPAAKVYTLAAILDPANAYPELDESNNWAEVRLTVRPRRVWISEILLYAPTWRATASPDTVEVGTAVHLHAIVMANGGFPDLRLVLKDNARTLLDHRRTLVSGCLGGVDADTTTWIASEPGLHVFSYEADPDREFADRADGPTRLERRLVVVP